MNLYSLISMMSPILAFAMSSSSFFRTTHPVPLFPLFLMIFLMVNVWLTSLNPFDYINISVKVVK